jgi:hypothetical protein
VLGILARNQKIKKTKRKEKAEAKRNERGKGKGKQDFIVWPAAQAQESLSW